MAMANPTQIARPRSGGALFNGQGRHSPTTE